MFGPGRARPSMSEPAAYTQRHANPPDMGATTTQCPRYRNSTERRHCAREPGGEPITESDVEPGRLCCRDAEYAGGQLGQDGAAWRAVRPVWRRASTGGLVREASPRPPRGSCPFEVAGTV